MTTCPDLTLAETLARVRRTAAALQNATGFARAHLVCQLTVDLARLERDGAFDVLAEVLSEEAAFAHTCQMAQLVAHLAEGAE